MENEKVTELLQKIEARLKQNLEAPFRAKTLQFVAPGENRRPLGVPVESVIGGSIHFLVGYKCPIFFRIWLSPQMDMMMLVWEETSVEPHDDVVNEVHNVLKSLL